MFHTFFLKKYNIFSSINLKVNKSFQVNSNDIKRTYKIIWLPTKGENKCPKDEKFLDLFVRYKIGRAFYKYERLKTELDPFIETYRDPKKDCYPAIEVTLDMWMLMDQHHDLTLPRFIFEQWKELFVKSETDSFIYEQFWRHLHVFFIKVSRRHNDFFWTKEPDESWVHFLRGDPFEDFYKTVVINRKQYYTDPFTLQDAITKYKPDNFFTEDEYKNRRFR